MARSTPAGTTGSRTKAVAFWPIGFVAAYDSVGYAVVGPVLPALKERAGASSLAASLIFAGFSIGMIAGYFIAGGITRRWGARATLLLGIAGHLAGDVLFIAGHGAALYTLARVVQGVGSGCMWLGVVMAVLTFWPERPEPKLGAILTSYAAGAVAGPLLGGLGGIVRPFLADAAIGLIAIVAAARLPTGEGHPFGWHLQALKDARLAFASAVVLLSSLVYASLEGSFVLRFSADLTQAALGALIAVVALASGVGAILPFATRGPERGRVVAQICLLGAGVLLILATAATAPLGWFAFLGSAGLLMGASETGALSLVASMPAGGMLTAMVAYSQAWALGFLIGPPGSTWLSDSFGHVAPGIALAAVAALAALLGFTVKRGPRTEEAAPPSEPLAAGTSVASLTPVAPVAPVARTAPTRLASPSMSGRETLHGLSDIRRFFRTNETPVYFVSATAFNLLGMDRWVRNLRFINYYDSFDGHHPNVFVPKEMGYREFESIEEICNYLLGHKEVADLVASRGRDGAGGRAAFLMFDEETEQLAGELGLAMAFPSAALRHRLDSKIETTHLGNAAGVPSVPNTLGRASTYRELLDLAKGAGLGSDLVVQTPYGDSGQTTFFVAAQGDWDEHEDDLVDEDLKVMKRIDCREAAIEAVVTRHGTLVGPLMTELTGFPELTPYGGGWCGNDIFPTALSAKHREQARTWTKAIGEALRGEGYLGYFELDFLADVSSDEMYLGELNPRVTGASSMTNVTAVAYGDMPLFLFHLLEFMDVDYEIGVEELNERWARAENVDAWSQFIMKQTDGEVELLTAAPASGVWRLNAEAPGGISFARRDTDWHDVADEGEAFYLRIAAAGDYRYPGADLGILVTRGRLMDDDHELTNRARAWISGIRAQFAGEPLPPTADVPAPEPFGFKML